MGRVPHPGFFKPQRSTAKVRLPGMEATKVYANPYCIWANALNQGSDGTTNRLVAGVLNPWNGSAMYASPFPGFLTTKTLNLNALTFGSDWFNQSDGATFDMLYPRAYRLNTETDQKIWIDGSVQCSEIPVVHRTNQFPNYFLGGYVPHAIIAHSNYEEGSVRLFDGRYYVAYSSQGPNTIFAELPLTAVP